MLPYIVRHTPSVVIHTISIGHITDIFTVHHFVHHHTSADINKRLQINVLAHDVMGKVVLAERLELPTARLQIGCSTN